MGKNYDYPLYAPYTKVDEFHKNKQNLDEIAPVAAVAAKGAAKAVAVGAKVIGRVAARGAVAATKAAGKGVRAVGKSTKKAVKNTAKEVGTTMAQAELARQVKKQQETENIKEEGAPTMNTGTANGAAGFSAGADENGPTAGLDAPLGGTAKQPKGKGGKVKKRKFKCRKADDGIHQVCEGKSDPRHLAFKVELDDIDFIFYGKSPADVKIALRKIYRPERLKSMKITRVLPGEVLKYYWDKRQGAM